MRSNLLGVILAAVVLLAWAGEAFAQGGYYGGYRSYYSLPYNNSYHGYWRDQGYGFSNRPYVETFHYYGGYAPYPYGYGYPAQPYGYGYRRW